MKHLSGLLLAVTLSQWAAPVRAVPIVDQSFGAPGEAHSGGVYYGVATTFEHAQTFTVGVSGSLTGAGMWLGAYDDPSYPAPGPIEPLTIQVRRTIGGLPSQDPGDVLTSVQLAHDDIRAAQTSDLPRSVAWIEWDFASAPLVTAGDQLALVLVAYPLPNPFFDETFAYFANGDDSQTEGPYAVPMYDDGRELYRFTTGSWLSLDTDFETWDIYFQTRIDPAGVPEPNSLASIALGLALLAISRGARPGRRSCTSPSRRPSCGTPRRPRR